ncbi:NUDIX domain-containing protein [Fulvivirgaceae bacterium BMA10]|uniref:NUDIX domain-containing protein n=1 Tax=Splendidivirga corallicola TaxID=3051826 RepID=A0ABT8KLT8_9BACT|nr:NUDIX domain-containing protein [Fulvivirgaceae bacterium BMA10]
MKIFINDIPVELISKKKLKNWDKYDVIKKGDDKMLIQTNLEGKILFVDISKSDLKKFLGLMQEKKFKKAEFVTIAVDDYEEDKKLIKDYFTIVRASGGLVAKNKKILMIYRLKKWDLPKGKLEDGEGSKEGAVREVEEECNIKVALNSKICATWHTYTRNKKQILKKTNWYLMECLDDSNMGPQIEEDIEKVVWKDEKEVRKALKNSYPSIKQVINKFRKKISSTVKS